MQWDAEIFPLMRLLSRDSSREYHKWDTHQLEWSLWQIATLSSSAFKHLRLLLYVFSLIDYTISHILIGLNASIASNLESDLLDYFPSKL